MTAGGFFARARRARGSSGAFSGSTCAGHQFFGGSLKKEPAKATTGGRKTPTLTSTQRKLPTSMKPVKMNTNGTEP